VSDVTLFWSLYDAALNGDFDAAAELIDDACEYVMIPPWRSHEGNRLS